MSELERVLEATGRHWDFSKALPLPQPGWLACPVCRAPEPRIRWWQFHLREKSQTTPYRCDISFKCVECAAVWLHGIVVTKEFWEKRPFPQRDRATIAWRHGRERLGL